ncbi:MAG: hypothetical protein JRC77_09475 [Deltaproteobacteria bacterium]|nr:hypothetical protein [Deltaproteobacteria bacterium]
MIDHKLRMIANRSGDKSLSRKAVTELITLYGAEPDETVQPENGPATYERAQALSELYTQHFNYDEPFDAAVVVNAWTACKSDPRCAEELDRFQRMSDSQIEAPVQ